MMNRSATRTVAAPSSAFSNGTARAVICANPGLTPVTSAEPSTPPSTVAMFLSELNHVNAMLVSGTESPFVSR